LGYGFFTYLDLKLATQSLSESLDLQKRVATLEFSKNKKEVTAEMQAIRETLEPEERKLALSDVIQSYSAGAQVQLKKRMAHFVEVESKYTEYLKPKVDFFEKRILYLMSIGVGFLILGLIVTREYITRAVFDRLFRVSRKMTDFLNGKYSYRFEVPASDELGELESTFNSMAQRVIQNMEELEALDIAKSEFLNIASHELRTPMTSIKGSLGLLTSGAFGPLDPEISNMIGIAEKETDRLIRLINEILDLAKIEARQMPMKKSWVSIDSIVQQCVQGLEGLSKSADVPIVAMRAPTMEVEVDKDRILQVLTNLLSNAIKYSPKGVPVEVQYETNGPGPIIISVCDKGRGIHPDEQAQIFEKFRQATNADNPLVKGTGLGLAIAKALVEQHQGHIGVQSDLGEGSKFYFTLPNWRVTSKKQKHDFEEAA
jgi:signal transduction histidine kinase